MIRRPADHDPERDVAAYVSGELSPKDLRRFETHLMECELCWREVQLNREGRRLAESGREQAPTTLREDVRAAVALSTESSRRRRRVAFAAIAIVVIMAAATGLVLDLGSSATQPPEIAAALASYRSGSMPLVPPHGSAPDLSAVGLTFSGGGATRLASAPADVFAYRAPSGDRVILFEAAWAFPEAVGATESRGMARGWTARADGLSLLCGSRPTSFLLVGTDPVLLQRAEGTLATQAL